MHLLEEILCLQKEGKPAGIYSCCSANPYVLEAVLERAKANDTSALIEATANQVDQYGGYTGMKPTDFHDYVMSLAQKTGVKKERVVLGGDHLGPLTWSNLDKVQAMSNAEELIRQYVLAGFTKIHIDTTMRLGDDSTSERLSNETIAMRSSRLCSVAEDSYKQRLKEHPNSPSLVYVIGSEVPIPGGAQEEEEPGITSPKNYLRTYDIFRETFKRVGLESAWNKVVGMVAQVGTEFGDTEVFKYDREQVKPLTQTLKKLPIVLEGHSTDYQSPSKLKQMVEDGIAILKVGPALTFALREALIALEDIEKELYAGTGVYLCDFRAVLEYAMLKNDRNWKKYYHGDGNRRKFARCFSYSDRARYYLLTSEVAAAIKRLVSNLEKAPIPDTLISQYMPVQYTKVRIEQLEPTPKELIKDRIGNCIDQYLYATIKWKEGGMDIDGLSSG